MKKEFIPYDLALELKKLGFNEPCFGFYIDNEVKYNIISIDKNTNNGWVDELFCTAPTFSQAFKFFREKYGLDSSIDREKIKVNGKWFKTKFYMYSISNDEEFPLSLGFDLKDDATYKEAELACIRKLIELAKEQNVK